MKKLFVTTFATAFVLALAIPALAQSVCGTPGTAGMPSCAASKGGACCVPPTGKISSKVIKSGSKSPIMKANKPVLATNIASQQATQSAHSGPADMGTGHGGNTITASASVSAQAAPAAPAMAAGPGTGTGGTAAGAAPAAAAGGAGKGASAGGAKGGGASAGASAKK